MWGLKGRPFIYRQLWVQPSDSSSVTQQPAVSSIRSLSLLHLGLLLRKLRSPITLLSVHLMLLSGLASADSLFGSQILVPTKQRSFQKWLPFLLGRGLTSVHLLRQRSPYKLAALGASTSFLGWECEKVQPLLRRTCVCGIHSPHTTASFSQS